MSPALPVSRAFSPANIAIVKYMGKEINEERPGSPSYPSNRSLSLTLGKLGTTTEVRRGPGAGDPSLHLSSDAVTARLMDQNARHRIQKVFQSFTALAGEGLQWLKSEGIVPPEFHPSFTWEWRTQNNFPEGAGLASSASAMASATLAMAGAVALAVPGGAERFSVLIANEDARKILAGMSSGFSGSSARCFHGEWVSWVGVSELDVIRTPVAISHFCIVVSAEKKEVSSSEAHLRVRSSPNFIGRVERANMREKNIRTWFGELELGSDLKGTWEKIRADVEAEYLDMHQLFHTAEPSFSYWTDRSLFWIELLKAAAKESSFEYFPWVTMDAGANLHLICRGEDESAVRRWIEERLLPTEMLLSGGTSRGSKWEGSLP